MAKYQITTEGGTYEVETGGGSSYPGEGAVKAAVGPAYEPAKAAVKGYMAVRKGAQDLAEQATPEKTTKLPVPNRPFLPQELLIPGDNYPLTLQDVSSKKAARDLSGMLVDQVATAGAGKAFEAVNASGLTRMGAVEANNPGTLDRLRSMQQSAKARSSVSKLLPAADVATDVKANRPAGVQVEGANIITKTKSPQDIVNKFRNEKDKVISQVDELVKANNKPVDPRVIFTRAKLLLSKKISNSTPAERKKMMEAFKDENRWVNEQQGKLDTVAANARKRYLYEETQGLQKKQAKGVTIITSPEKLQVQDAFAQAYKEIVEQAHKDIHKLNSRFAGLESGENAASKLVKSTSENKPLGQRMIETAEARPNKTGLLASVIRKVYDPNSVQSLSGNIEKLSKQAAESSVRSRLKQAPKLLGSFMDDAAKPNSQYFKELLPPEDFAALSVGQGQMALPPGKAISGEGFETLGPEAAAKARLKDFQDPTRVKASPKQAGLIYEKSNLLGNESGAVRIGDNLHKLAAKYSNADEFKKALDINYRDSWRGNKNPNAEWLRKQFDGYLFHGTNASDKIKTSGFKKGNYINSGVYFSETPDSALDYMRQARSAGAKSDVFVVDSRDLKIKDVGSEMFRKINKGMYNEAEELLSKLKKQGYDGVKYSVDGNGEHLVWNVDKLKSPMTLSEVWNNSKKTTGILPSMAAGSAAAITLAGKANASDDQNIGKRLNNPFNVKGNDKWLGSTGRDKWGHHIFESIDHGIRAGVRNLENHASKNPDQTLMDYFSKQYATKNGDKEAKYIADKMGIKPDAKLKDIDMREAAKHVAMFESKTVLTDEQISRAMKIKEPTKKLKSKGKS